MSVKMPYPKIVIAKVQRLIDRGLREIPVRQDPRYKMERDLDHKKRQILTEQRIGLGLGYLRGIIAGNYLEPSGRVLKNLGFEIYVKDLETGEMEKVDYFGRCQVDHSDPANPRVLVEE
jgi:hypothetical protein